MKEIEHCKGPLTDHPGNYMENSSAESHIGHVGQTHLSMTDYVFSRSNLETQLNTHTPG